ncbi:hypothetical protein DERP_013733 [Dermatophagoides pteronyssinus]|uniref:Uncharacterized protein n=1 Tax=Dermatophagoides pteronyssinus TaxID=6956 RepID=A0ABQ8JFB9_DERPT|nr:hypothetical protein DERP_013733 [Dermatophagoides pteronyssinus]
MLLVDAIMYKSTERSDVFYVKNHIEMSIGIYCFYITIAYSAFLALIYPLESSSSIPLPPVIYNY